MPPKTGGRGRGRKSVTAAPRQSTAGDRAAASSSTAATTASPAAKKVRKSTGATRGGKRPAGKAPRESDVQRAYPLHKLQFRSHSLLRSLLKNEKLTSSQLVTPHHKDVYAATSPEPWLSRRSASTNARTICLSKSFLSLGWSARSRLTSSLQKLAPSCGGSRMRSKRSRKQPKLSLYIFSRTPTSARFTPSA